MQVLLTHSEVSEIRKQPATGPEESEEMIDSGDGSHDRGIMWKKSTAVLSS